MILDTIRAFAHHRIAPNLLMLMMLCGGLFVAGRMEVRFLPEFEVQTIVVRVAWRGAAAEDIADSALTPLEAELRHSDDLKRIFSYARDGSGSIYLEYPDEKDIDEANRDVRRRIDFALPKLPSDSERPEVETIKRNHGIMRLSLTGDTLAQLRAPARRIESELLRLNVARVEVEGLPTDEIQIRLDQRRLTEIGLTARQIGNQIAAQNIDISAGQLRTGGANTRLLRTLSQRLRLDELAQLLILDENGNVVRLGDIAEITRAPERDAQTLFFNGKPAVEFYLINKDGGNSLQAAKTVLAWAEQNRATLPPGFTLTAHRERWQTIKSRLQLLIKNGLQGLVLVLLLLLIFLNFRLAFWVAAGIPATFMVGLAVLYLSGGSINMISMFAFIMVTGIVVDDAIVVGENAMYHLQKGKSPLAAAVTGAQEMFVSVFSSTFTTLASFAPLLVIGGVVGSIMAVIPTVVICVLLASLFECFAVLPGHMRGAFTAFVAAGQKRFLRLPDFSGVRRWIDDGFDRFQHGQFRRSVALALRYNCVTFVMALTALFISLSLLYGGLLKYRFFPGAELSYVQAQVTFAAGTPKATVEEFVRRLVDSVQKTAAEFPEEQKLVRYISVYMGRGGRGQGGGDEKANVFVELAPADERDIGTRKFTRTWRRHLPQQAGLESLVLREERAGPPGEDLEIRLRGDDLDALKAAAMELRTRLEDIPGVSRARDDLPYGKAQTVFELNSLGRSLNLTVEEIAAQLRDNANGFLIQTVYENIDETELRVVVDSNGVLPDGDFADVRIRLPNGGYVRLGDVAELRSRRGYDVILRDNNRLMVNIIANIDFGVTDVGQVNRQVAADILPPILARHGVLHSFEGSSSDERETGAGMRFGLLIALLSIYVILAAVFSSWTLPLVILLTVPFGLIGAIWGHWLLGYELSILSAFGVFALNGIIVNDSIILIRDYLARRQQQPDADADTLITDAVCRRLRAIMLTSLTTIGGLLPLMFEQSIQAQFLIPMAISICFGLGFATLLILYLTPALVSIHNDIAGRWRSFFPVPAMAAGGRH